MNETTQEKLKRVLARHTAGGMELEIHDLQAENQRLREALEKIEAEACQHVDENGYGPGREIIGITDEALAGDQGRENLVSQAN